MLPVSTRLRFGLVTPSSDVASRVDALARFLGEPAGLVIELRPAATYEALATAVKEGEVDAAWLPPIVYVRVAGHVEVVGAVDRGERSSYEAALVVREDSGIDSVEGLRGMRAGWVDPWSAAGFVMPRVKLALVGVDPRALFRTERFHGSHRAALQALVEGACDVVGTHAQAGADGAIASGAWKEVDARIRVLATFGAIPPDVVALAKHAPAEARAGLLEGFRRAAEEPAAREALVATFGGTSLREGRPQGYAALESALAFASQRGLFD